MFEYQLIIKDSGGSIFSTYDFNTFEQMEFWASQFIEHDQPAGGSAEYQRRPGTWDGSGWTYGSWGPCP